MAQFETQVRSHRACTRFMAAGVSPLLLLLPLLVSTSDDAV